MPNGWNKPGFSEEYSYSGSVPSHGQITEGWDMYYPQQGTGSPFQNYFNQYLGEGVDVYDPQSIAASLMAQYDVSDLTPGMFPALSRDLVASAQASTYDAYKSGMAKPHLRQYRSQMAKTAGLLNPNRRRKRAKRMLRSGMGDIKSDIFNRTTVASERIRDWMSNALKKVMRMKY